MLMVLLSCAPMCKGYWVVQACRVSGSKPMVLGLIAERYSCRTAGHPPGGCLPLCRRPALPPAVCVGGVLLCG